MRIWSLHPKYLDSKGLVALWRETLLAQHVLLGTTKGYKNHPQLLRFKKLKDPVNGINYYLSVVYEEANARGYNFDRRKFPLKNRKVTIKVHDHQLQYEWNHLLLKLKRRDSERYLLLKDTKYPEAHPLFKIVAGDIEEWEVTK